MHGDGRGADQAWEPAQDSKDGSSCGEAGARAVAVQREHRQAHRGGVHSVPGMRGRGRGRAGGAGHQLVKGARHDVPQVPARPSTSSSTSAEVNSSPFVFSDGSGAQGRHVRGRHREGAGLALR